MAVGLDVFAVPSFASRSPGVGLDGGELTAAARSSLASSLRASSDHSGRSAASSHQQRASNVLFTFSAARASSRARSSRSLGKIWKTYQSSVWVSSPLRARNCSDSADRPDRSSNSARRSMAQSAPGSSESISSRVLRSPSESPARLEPGLEGQHL